jgi:hypothetical protein
MGTTATNGRANVVKQLMASQHRKHRGYRTQRVIADYLKTWYPHAESAGAGRTGSDVTNVPFDIEIKARAGFDPKSLLNQLKVRSKDKLGFGVMRLNGQGETPEDYCVIMRFEDLCHLLEQAKYPTQPLEMIPERCPKCGEWKIKDMECQLCQLMNSNATNAKR